MIFYAPFVERQDEWADKFMRGGLERVIFEFGEARIASCDIGEGKQARHGFGGFDIGVEQRSPCGGAELHGLFS